MRKIKLYEIINNDLYCELLKRDIDGEIERDGFILSSSVDVLKDMKDEVENNLRSYNDREVEKMRTCILNGTGWHGEKIKGI